MLSYNRIIDKQIINACMPTMKRWKMLGSLQKETETPKNQMYTEQKYQTQKGGKQKYKHAEI